MGKLPVILSILCLLLGGMMGYTFAYSRIYQHLKQERSQQPAPFEAKVEPLPPAEAASFPLVIQRTTGHSVLSLDSVCEPVLAAIATAASATMVEMNAENTPLKGLARINEASRFFEDSLLEKLDQLPDLSCQIPVTRAGKAQRSGYPDLMITHQPTGRVYYLDPKLYEATSQDSSLRTFYYTPRAETSKILKPGHHLLIGFAHDGKDGQWTFQSWKLVDLSQIELKLKSEYNASNKELYQPEFVVKRSQDISVLE